MLLFLFAIAPEIEAQDKKPKVALVLSGGGAKGLAHIPTLQMLDSLGIVPDLIVGTSMGSIVGGLYAMGYSGDSIASIALSANWNKLLRGGVSLNDVSVEEKSEYNKYLVGLNWSERKLNTGSYLLNDQNIREFLSILTYPTYRISSFDDFSIPFRAVATDIVNGSEVVFDKGMLSFALRASMSIPGAFSAVSYENTLLVDGGVLNNFPVDIAKSMDADFIIGSDVGGGMATKEKLNNIGVLLFQAGMLSSNIKNPENRKLCDILIDHTSILTINTGEFNKVNTIYNEGKIAVNKNLEALIALSNNLKKYTQKEHKLPVIKNEFLLDTIIYRGINQANLDLIKARINIESNKKYTREELSNGLNRAMGTTVLSQINFNPIIKGDTLGLELNGYEKSKHQLKGSLHYDGDKGVGVIVNFTGRNILGSASRSLITIDITEQPKVRFQHQRHFTKSKNWWWRSEAYGQRTIQKIVIEGKNIENFKYQYLEYDSQINKNLSFFKSYFGLGLKNKNTYLKPVIDPQFKENIFSLTSYKFRSFELYTHYIYNSLNDGFYATNGTYIKANLSSTVDNNINLRFFDPNISNINGTTNSFTKYSFDFEKRFIMSSKNTGIFNINTGYTFEGTIKNNDVPYSKYGLGGNYFLGGNIANPRQDSYRFLGLKEGELAVSQFINLGYSLQINAMNKIYVTPHADLAYVGFGNFGEYVNNTFTKKGKWSDSDKASFLASVGGTFSYDSVLGPVNIDLSWVNNTNKINFFIGIGLHFNR